MEVMAAGMLKVLAGDLWSQMVVGAVELRSGKGFTLHTTVPQCKEEDYQDDLNVQENESEIV